MATQMHSVPCTEFRISAATVEGFYVTEAGPQGGYYPVMFAGSLKGALEFIHQRLADPSPSQAA